MSFEEFNALSDQQKMEVVRTNGVYLTKRDNPICSIFLFQLDGFYIEAFFHHKRNCITNIRSFRSIAALQPYLDKIELKHLY